MNQIESQNQSQQKDTIFDDILQWSHLSIFPTKESHDTWLKIWILENQQLILQDNRGKFSCCHLTPYCPWCLLDFVTRHRIKKLSKKMIQFRKQRFHKIWRRQLTGRW